MIKLTISILLIFLSGNQVFSEERKVLPKLNCKVESDATGMYTAIRKGDKSIIDLNARIQLLSATQFL